MKIKLLLLLIFIFDGCNQKTIEPNKTNINSKLVELKSESRECKCYDDFEEKPIKTFSFSDNNSISICGYKENDEYSEFSVFDCKTEKLVCKYDATQTCKLNFESDKLHIIELNKLPTNNNWDWKDVEISEEIVTIKNNLIISMGIKPLKIEVNISEKSQTDFLNLLETENYKKIEVGEILGRLEILAIIGNERATKKLYSLQNDKGYLLDGALAEQYKDAIATIEWRRNFKN